MIMDEDKGTPPTRYTIGQDVSTFSLEELRHTIAALREEIARLEREIASKSTTKAAAEALFRQE